jgi:hypothetical protein
MKHIICSSPCLEERLKIRRCLAPVCPAHALHLRTILNAVRVTQRRPILNRSNHSHRPRHNIMILRIVKAAAVVGIWYRVSPWFVERVPDLVLQHWKSDHKQWAILEALSLWLQTLIFITAVINAWKFGERQSNGERLFVQSGKLLKYSGVSLLFILLLSMLVSPLPPKDHERTVKLCIAAYALFMAVAVLLLRSKKGEKTVYGLQHGRLHLNAHVPMWMNMGYWKVSVLSQTHSEPTDPFPVQ